MASGAFDVAFDIGGFFSGFAGAGAVFDVLEVAEEVFAFAAVVAGAGADRLWEERGHAVGAAGADAEEDELLGGDAAEVVDAGAEGSVEDAAFSGIGEGAEAGPVVCAGCGHWVRVHDEWMGMQMQGRGPLQPRLGRVGLSPVGCPGEMLLSIVGESGANEEVTEVCFECDEHREKGVEIATGCSDSGDLATDHEVFVIPGPRGVA